jgi:hypothetical protein
VQLERTTAEGFVPTFWDSEVERASYHSTRSRSNQHLDLGPIDRLLRAVKNRTFFTLLTDAAVELFV